MRFLELHLQAYGPFTDQVLDLAGGHEGLHVVYGPNEAGKSSALRAVHAFLFGIPGQTKDDFRHDYRDLRVGARLRGADGAEILLWRRKGNKDTLLGADGAPVDETVLARLLGGVTSAVFEDAFGLDHDRLVQGGKILLEGGGEVGRSLFAAGLGGSRLQALLAGIDAQAEELFKGGNASKPLVNRLIAEHKRIRSELRDATVSVGRWTGDRKALDETEAEVRRLADELRDRTNELARLERIERCLPKLAERAELGEGIQALVAEGPTPTLRPGFAEERRQAERSLGDLQGTVEQAGQLTGRLAADLAAIEVPEALLGRRDAIQALVQDLGTERKAAKDRIGLEAKRLQGRRDAFALLRQLRPEGEPDEGSAPSVSVLDRRLVEDLGGARDALRTGIEKTKGAQEKTRRLREQVVADLEGCGRPPDVRALQARVARARKEGDLEGEAARLRREAAADRRLLEADGKALGRWAGRPEDLEALPLPVGPTVDAFDAHLTAAQAGVRAVRDEIERQDRLHRQTVRDLAGLDRGGEVPTEDALLRARERRDEGWGLVRRAWLDGEDVDEAARGYDPERPLPEAYEGAVGAADAVADRLRADADRAAPEGAVARRPGGAGGRPGPAGPGSRGGPGAGSGGPGGVAGGLDGRRRRSALAARDAGLARPV